MKVKFVIEKEARKSGGDKYVAEGFSNFNIYFPQEISRVQGMVRSEIIVEILED